MSDHDRTILMAQKIHFTTSDPSQDGGHQNEQQKKAATSVAASNGAVAA